jgi:hypothetical protein
MTITTFEARINVDVKAFDRLLIEALEAQDESEGTAGLEGLSRNIPLPSCVGLVPAGDAEDCAR